MPNTEARIVPGSYLMPSFRLATVADAMHPGIVCCPPDVSLIEAARAMATNHVHCIAVMGISHDRPSERFVWGLISDLDLMRACIRLGPEDTAGALALEPIVSVGPTMSLNQAGELMLKHGVNHLVVIEPDTQRPVGILSTLDIIGVVAWGEA